MKSTLLMHGEFDTETLSNVLAAFALMQGGDPLRNICQILRAENLECVAKTEHSPQREIIESPDGAWRMTR